MKKIIAILALIFMVSCGAKPSREIKQVVNYDNVSNKYSVTTRFELPRVYWECVYLKSDSLIDSVRTAEFKKAIDVQKQMDLKLK